MARLTGIPWIASSSAPAARCSSQLASSSGRVTTTISSASKRASASSIACSGIRVAGLGRDGHPGRVGGEPLGRALGDVAGAVLVVREPLQPRLPHLRDDDHRHRVVADELLDGRAAELDGRDDEHTPGLRIHGALVPGAREAQTRFAGDTPG